MTVTVHWNVNNEMMVKGAKKTSSFH